MKLPNGNHAVVSMEKLRGYCLNYEHPSGKNKARVFASALGITAENAEELYILIARAAVQGDVAEQTSTGFGQILKVDWPVPGYDQTILRTIWETTLSSPNPRLVSSFIK